MSQLSILIFFFVCKESQVKNQAKNQTQLFPIESGPRDLYVEEDPSATQRNIFFGEDKFVGSNSSGGDGRRRRIAMPHSLAVYREYGTEAGVEKHLVAR